MWERFSHNNYFSMIKCFIWWGYCLISTSTQLSKQIKYHLWLIQIVILINGFHQQETSSRAFKSQWKKRKHASLTYSKDRKFLLKWRTYITQLLTRTKINFSWSFAQLCNYQTNRFKMNYLIVKEFVIIQLNT